MNGSISLPRTLFDLLSSWGLDTESDPRQIAKVSLLLFIFFDDAAKGQHSLTAFLNVNYLNVLLLPHIFEF